MESEEHVCIEYCEFEENKVKSTIATGHKQHWQSASKNFKANNVRMLALHTGGEGT